MPVLGIQRDQDTIMLGEGVLLTCHSAYKAVHNTELHLKHYKHGMCKVSELIIYKVSVLCIALYAKYAEGLARTGNHPRT